MKKFSALVLSACFCAALVSGSSVEVNDQSETSTPLADNYTTEEGFGYQNIIHLPDVKIIKLVTDPTVCVCDGPYAFGGCVRGVRPLGFTFAGKTEEDATGVVEDKTEVPVTTEETVDVPKEARQSDGISVVTGRANCRCGATTFKDDPAPGYEPFTCKLPNNQTKIVGGNPTSIRRYPWTVALVRSGSSRPFCGGTLINDRYIVTANHCVDGQQPGRIKVFISQENFPFYSSNNMYSVSEIKMHSGYNRQNIDNDIALLKLSSTVRLGGGTVPVCLPASNVNDFSGQTATVCGWGATSEGGSLSSVIREVQVPIISNQRCNTATNYRGKITENMMCAGEDQGGKDSCQGDSGGPLIIANGGRSTLVGVVSWGHGCARPKSPGVYARVARYPSWILQNTRDADWCDG